MNIRRIDIISVPVSDQNVAKRFYSNALGFEVIRDNPMGPNQQWVQMRPPGAETSITLLTWFISMTPSVVQGMVWDTTDVESARDELASRGLDISEIANAPWGRYATFADPDGNGWVLQQAQS